MAEPLTLPQPGSVEEFITEHYWGYTQGPGYTLEYQVKHEPWVSCRVKDYQIDVDFAATYGDSFAFLNRQPPHSVQYALGSPITVSFPGRI